VLEANQILNHQKGARTHCSRPFSHPKYFCALPLIAASLSPIGPASIASAQAQVYGGQQPNVADFLDRAEPLMRLGPLGLAHPDASKLTAQVVQAARTFKSRNDAQKRANIVRKSCPPESGDLSPETWIAHLRSYPAAMRPRIPLSAAFEHLMEKQFPCPAR
jgi:hypothetical protein